MYIYMNDSREGRTRRRMWYVQYSRCIFWTYFFIAAPIFYISILKLYHRWYDIVSIILLYVGSIYVLTHNVLGQIMYFKSIGIITSHKFSNLILNTWSLICQFCLIKKWKKSCNSEDCNVYVNYEIPTQQSECEMHLEVQRKLDLGRLKITQLESN